MHKTYVRAIKEASAESSHFVQRGCMLVISLLVILVLTLLGLTITRLLSSSSETIFYEVVAQRLLSAARAGIEFEEVLIVDDLAAFELSKFSHVVTVIFSRILYVDARQAL